MTGRYVYFDYEEPEQTFSKNNFWHVYEGEMPEGDCVFTIYGPNTPKMYSLINVIVLLINEAIEEGQRCKVTGEGYKI